MTFPSERELEFFTSEEARPIQSLWEPKVGDWFVSSVSGVSGIAWWDDPIRQIEEEKAEPFNNGEVFWLPRLDQLQEILEEMGWNISFSREDAHYTDAPAEKGYMALIYKGRWPEPFDKFEVSMTGWGETPAIAFSKALIEVIPLRYMVRRTGCQRYLCLKLRRRYNPSKF